MWSLSLVIDTNFFVIKHLVNILMADGGLSLLFNSLGLVFLVVKELPLWLGTCPLVCMLTFNLIIRLWRS